MDNGAKVNQDILTKIKKIMVIEETGRGHFTHRVNHYPDENYVLLDTPTVYHNGGNTKFIVTMGKVSQDVN